jgi:hypothetical protein
MSELVKVKLHLSQPNFDKLRKGKHAQLSHHQLTGATHHLMVHPTTAKRINKAIRQKKGIRVKMSEHELSETAHGGGFGDFINKLKDAGSWLKKNIIDSSFYQSNIKPIARNLVDSGLAAVAPRLGAAAPVANSAVNAIGQATGAFGLGKHKHHEEKLKEFIAESAVMPRPGGPAGFSALPQASTGSGVNAQHIHHHYYYPFDHTGHGGRGGRGSHGGSFKLA